MSFRTQSNSANVSGGKTAGTKQVDHYIQLFLQKLWFVIPVSIIVMAVWFIAITRLGLMTPQLDATTILQFDDPTKLSAVDERVELQSDTKAVLVKSRSFIEGVVRKLSLQFQMSRVARSDVFDSVFVDLDAPVGYYKMAVDHNSYSLFYNDVESKKRNLIKSGKLSEISSLRIPGLVLRWNKNYVKDPFSFKFSVKRIRDAVDDIIGSMTVKTSGKDFTIMSVSISGRDYELITKVANTIADDFVKENSDTKKGRKAELLGALEKQLETAKTEMIEAEAGLRQFREQNPTVGLTDAFAPPVRIMELEDTEAELKSALLQAKSLLERYRNTKEENKVALLHEMIAFMVRYQTGTSEAFQTELDQLTEQSKTLQEQYSPFHPLVKENKNKTAILAGRVNSAFSDLLVTLNRKIKENNEKIDKFNGDIERLPANELKLANLQRKYEVNSQIFSNVLTRYNELKIAIATEIGDVYVVDHAVEPEKAVDPRTLITFVGLGIILGLIAGFGPVATVDYFDRTARTERDLRRMTDFVVLESIPVKGYWGKSRGSADQRSIDEKLVAADYTHNFVDETYRSLRAKILLSLHEEKKKRILITSLNMGEGKSFTAANLAITMAQQRIPTLLLDGDLKRGVQHYYFGREKKPGLSNFLVDNSPISASCIQPVLQSTHIPQLTLLGAGSSVPNSAELLNSPRFRELLDFLSNNFEMIILDTPPMAVVTDAVGVQDAFNKYIVVVHASHTNITELNRKIKEYPGLKKKVMGIVFNGAPYKRTEYYQYNSYKY